MKLSLFTFCFVFSSYLFSQGNVIDPVKIAADNFNSIVKILLFDSVKEKKQPGTGLYGRGSGFLVTEDGLIFTNSHVVKPALGITNYSVYNYENDKIVTKVNSYLSNQFSEDLYAINYISTMSIIVQVFDKPELNSSTQYYAKVVAIDTSKNFDGAIIQITSKINGDKVTEPFNPVTLGDSDSTRQGEDLCIIGFPKKYEGNLEAALNDQSTLDCGKHAGFDFYAMNKDVGSIILSITVNAGNSGGPAFNSRGEVIGLASASSDKTGNGFVGKINGMYNLAKNDFALLTKLKNKGLVNPPQKVNESGILNNPNYQLPSSSRISRFNKEQKKIRTFVGGFWYLKAGVVAFNANTYTLEANQEHASSKLSSDLEVKTTSSFNFEFGKVLNPWRPINKYNKLNIDLSLLNVTYSSYDWSNAKLFKDTNNTSFIASNDQTQLAFSSKIGLIYSTLIKKRFFLDFYYKFGISVKPEIHFSQSKESIGNYRDNQTGMLSTHVFNNTYSSLVNTVGFNFHFNHVILGLEYTIGKNYGEDLYYGEIDDVNLGIQSIELKGNHFISNLNVFLGFPMYNSKRWKTFSY